MNHANNPDTPDRKKASGVPGYVIPAVMLASIILAIVWRYPANSELGEILWEYATIPRIIGFIFASAGLAVYYMEKKSIEGCTVPVTATITEIVAKRGSNPSGPGSYTQYFPVYTYFYNDGKISVEGRGFSTDRNHYTVGTVTEMLISPENPKNYCIKSETEKTYQVGKVMAGIGIAAFAFSLLLWIVAIPIGFFL